MQPALSGVALQCSVDMDGAPLPRVSGPQKDELEFEKRYSHLRVRDGEVLDKVICSNQSRTSQNQGSEDSS